MAERHPVFLVLLSSVATLQSFLSAAQLSHSQSSQYFDQSFPTQVPGSAPLEG